MIAPIINVLYGTVTGNAEEIARRIFALVPSKNLQPGSICGLADFGDIPAFVKPADHLNTYSVIVVSTTGDGDPPETIRPFMRLIRSKDKSRLTGLNYAVLGLGDTNYENFCRTGKRIDAGLSKLGAQRFLPRGDADDGVGLELVVEPWISSLWTFFEQLSYSTKSESKPQPDLHASNLSVPSDEPVNIEELVRRVTAIELGFDESKLPPIPSPKLLVDVVDSEGEQNKSYPSIHPSYSSSTIRIGFVQQARLLTAPDAEKTVWHIELNCKDSYLQSNHMTYRPGDAFGVMVENNTNEVLRFLRTLPADPQQLLCIRNQNGDTLGVATVERFVRERLDLRALPSKTLLRVLSEYTDDVQQRKELLHLSSRLGRTEYTARITRRSTSVLDVLETIAPSCMAPIDVYLDLLPSIPLRWYSATSSPELDGHNVLHFAFSVVENGLATNALNRRCKAFLAGKSVDHVKILPRESDTASHFRPPVSLETSYIMVGPGTGVAPFRGFLRERQVLIQNAAEPSKNVKTMLFFGCRHSDKDFLYRGDLEDLVQKKVLSVLDVAFSRAEKKKVYVQDRLLERSEEVAEIIREGGSVYVCGDGGGMAMGVQTALTKVVTDVLCDGNEIAGKAMMKDLASSHRYVRDIWYYGS